MNDDTITVNKEVLQRTGINLNYTYKAGMLSEDRVKQLKALGAALRRDIDAGGGQVTLTTCNPLTPHLLQAISDIKQGRAEQSRQPEQGHQPGQGYQPGQNYQPNRSQQTEHNHQQQDGVVVEGTVVRNEVQDIPPAGQYSKPARRIKLKEGPGFSRAAAEAFNPLNYGVVPQFTGKDGKLHYKPYKNLYQQFAICLVNDASFNDSRMSLLIVDDDEYHFVFVDCDLHKDGSLTAKQVREQLGIDYETFSQAVIQSTEDATSIHLLFRIPADLWNQIVEDTARTGEKAFKTSIKDSDDSRVPQNVEIKLHRQYQQIRLKPGKVLFCKEKSEFPMLPESIRTIITDARDSKQAEIDRRQQARANARPVDTTDLNRLEKRRHGWAMTKVRRKVEEIQGLTCDRHNQINNCGLEIGHYIDSCQLDYNYVYEELMAAGRTTGLEENRIREAVISGLRDGRKEYIDPALKD